MFSRLGNFTMCKTYTASGNKILHSKRSERPLILGAYWKTFHQTENRSPGCYSCLKIGEIEFQKFQTLKCSLHGPLHRLLWTDSFAKTLWQRGFFKDLVHGQIFRTSLQWRLFIKDLPVKDFHSFESSFVTLKTGWLMLNLRWFTWRPRRFSDEMARSSYWIRVRFAVWILHSTQGKLWICRTDGRRFCTRVKLVELQLDWSDYSQNRTT